MLRINHGWVNVRVRDCHFHAPSLVWITTSCSADATTADAVDAAASYWTKTNATLLAS